MKLLPDPVIAHLQSEMQTPDLSGTRYRLIKLLGSGGMGTVWLAEDNVLHRTLALKVLRAESIIEDLAARLMQEALVLARLEHPGIVPVHDASTLADGRTFYCMKYVEGETLDQHIVGLNLRQRLVLLQRVAEPVAFAHSRGIIHRDLKPGNIMVGPFGEVVVMDWGLAKVLQPPAAGAASGLVNLVTASPLDAAAAPARHQATKHGTVLGTPGYMAPEQARGDVALIEPRSDVFSLGALMQFMILGKCDRGETQPPRRLLAIYEKATATEIPARYHSVQELTADIGRYLDDRPVDAYPENTFERAGRLLSHNRAAVLLVLAYLFMRVLFILFSWR